MLKGILIDLGDTVFYNTKLSFLTGANYLYDMLSLPRPEKEVFFASFTKLVSVCLRERSLIEVPFLNFLAFLQTYCDVSFSLPLAQIEVGFALSFSKNSLVPKIISFLEFCKKNNLKVIALSNSAFSSNTLIYQLKNFNIYQYFTEVLSSSDYILRKPSIFFFNMGIKKLGLGRDEILFIGNDYEIDILGALNAELRVAWFNEAQAVNPQGVYSFVSYLDLIEAIKNEVEHV